MHGVMPGDVLRLDRAVQLGSREFTLRGGVATGPRLGAQKPARVPRAPDLEEEDAGVDQLDAAASEPTTTEPIIGKTADLHPSVTQGVPFPNVSSQLRKSRPKVENRPGYIDPELFVCRATVLSTESEPLRVKEKTKRRNRHVRHVFSKHRYTVLRVSEVTVRGVGLGGDGAKKDEDSVSGVGEAIKEDAVGAVS